MVVIFVYIIGRIRYKIKGVKWLPIMFKISGFYRSRAGIYGIVDIFFLVDHLKFIPLLEPEEIYGPCIYLRKVVGNVIIDSLFQDSFGEGRSYDSRGLPFHIF